MSVTKEQSELAGAREALAGLLPLYDEWARADGEADDAVADEDSTEEEVTALCDREARAYAVLMDALEPVAGEFFSDIYSAFCALSWLALESLDEK